MTVQNWSCEISKYLRGESKNKYSVPAGTIKPLPEPVASLVVVLKIAWKGLSQSA
jgi:hypothetical protein